MATTKSMCRIGVFYDGSYVNEARKFFYYKQKAGLISYLSFHQCIQNKVSSCDSGFSDYRVVYAAWFQGMFAADDANTAQLDFDRRHHHELMHAGIETKFEPMASSQKKEKGVDVALAVDALQAGLDDKIDVAALVTGDGDYVPLVRALMRNGVRTIAVYFEYEYQYEDKNKKSFINPRLARAVNYKLNVTELEGDDRLRLFR